MVVEDAQNLGLPSEHLSMLGKVSSNANGRIFRASLTILNVEMSTQGTPKRPRKLVGES